METSQTSLHRNPFWLLAVSPRDTRQRIVEQADVRALEVDHDRCQRARAQITSPRTRIAAEVGWLPGVSPSRAAQLVRRLAHEPLVVRSEAGLPPLARVNVLAAAIEAAGPSGDVDTEAAVIREIAVLVDQLDFEEIRRDVNEDRAVAGFPAVASPDAIEEAVLEHRHHVRTVVRDALDRLPTRTLIAVMTRAVEASTDGGEYHAPQLMDALVEAYEVEAHEFLEKEAENVAKLVGAARGVAGRDAFALGRIIDAIDRVTRNWDQVAQPVQLSVKARGLEHEASTEVALAIRRLAIELVNEHDRLEDSRRLTRLLQDVFAEVPEVAERVEADADILDDMVGDREAWLRAISYEAEVGLFAKRIVRISGEGVSWAGRTYPLHNITRVRWGGMSHSVNGIPTGTNYIVAFGDSTSESVIRLRRQATYSALVDRLWKAVGPRISVQLLRRLQAGEQISFGEAVVADDGVTLKRRRFLATKEDVRCRWHEVRIWSADGSFVIGAKGDKKTYAEMSYMNVANVPILEHAIRLAFGKPIHRLSDVLKDDN